VHRRPQLHQAIGCPSLSIKANPDPLRTEPIAHVDNDCVGCGMCGEVSHAAVLCPSFYRAEIIYNNSAWDRAVSRFRGAIIRWFQPAARGRWRPRNLTWR